MNDYQYDWEIVFDGIFEAFEAEVGLRGRDWDFDTVSDYHLRIDSYIPIPDNDLDRLMSALDYVERNSGWYMEAEVGFEGHVEVNFHAN